MKTAVATFMILSVFFLFAASIGIQIAHYVMGDDEDEEE